MKTIDLQSESVVALTKKEKLLHWAEQIRNAPCEMLLFHNVEHWHHPEHLNRQLAEYGANPFSVAAEDPVFVAAGIAGSSVADAMKFFELSQDELHTFSCDCGGKISNVDMAHRIERLANRGESRPESRPVRTAMFGMIRY